MDIWGILLIFSILLLILYWGKGRNAVWGSLTLGIIIGFIIGFISFLKGDGFSWIIIERCAIAGVFFGFLSEILGIASDKLSK